MATGLRDPGDDDYMSRRPDAGLPVVDAEAFLADNRVKKSVPNVKGALTAVFRGSSRAARFNRLRLVTLLLLALETLVVIGFLAYELVKMPDNTGALVVLLELSLGVLGMAFDAFLSENKSALLTFFLAQSLLVAFSVYRYIAYPSTSNVDLARLVLSAVFFVGNTGAVVAGFLTFGWQLTRIVGTDPVLRRAFKLYQAYHSLLGLDFVMGVVCVTMVGFFWFQELEIVLDCIALLVSLCWLVLGWWAARRERAVLMVVWFVLSPVEPVYIVIKLVFILEAQQLTALLAPFLVLFCIALLGRLLLVVAGILVTMRFGSGLAETVFAPQKDFPRHGSGALL